MRFLIRGSNGKSLPKFITAICKLCLLCMALVYVVYLHIHCAVDAVKLYFTLDMLLLSLCFIYTGMIKI